MRLCRVYTLLIVTIVLPGLLSTIGGCGAKGDLYLPHPEQANRE